MEVPLFFPVSAVAQMLGQVSAKFVERELAAGRFFPINDAGEVDSSTVVCVAGKVMISLVGVHWYLQQRCAWAKARTAAEFLAKELAGAPAHDLIALGKGLTGIAARSEGELRRRLANG